MVRDEVTFIAVAVGLVLIGLLGWCDGYRRARRSWAPRRSAALCAIGDFVTAAMIASSVMLALLTGPEVGQLAGSPEAGVVLSLGILAAGLYAGLSVARRVEDAIHRRVDRSS